MPSHVKSHFKMFHLRTMYLVLCHRSHKRAKMRAQKRALRDERLIAQFNELYAIHMANIARVEESYEVLTDSLSRAHELYEQLDATLAWCNAHI